MNADIAKKLRWKPGMRFLILNPSEEAWSLFSSGYEDASPVVSHEPLSQGAGAGSFDLVLLYVSSAAELAEWSSAALSAVSSDGLLWVAYPKKTSKIKTDIHRDQGWEPISEAGWEGVALVSLDETWSAMRFRPAEKVKKPRAARVKEEKPVSSSAERIVVVPEDLQAELDKQEQAKQFFDRLAYTHRKEYVRWITEAKRPETRAGRITKTLERLNQGIKNPFVK
ncbi:YdeI/OmpD-associated family protein [Brevibacillus choshinensis]|uniref:YdeI/OmpD-associated family protein n=1 Tax=Brevibacillus choshinensis TaxID=54911 RepID=A0ABX7FX37_BRECH|nr:YdeI/OmpD-associated family protein [Brevibacillus choshinensis]QRG70354.1 YdeI/OmpD-associated family protein [Brevibacillus choshinensis]